MNPLSLLSSSLPGLPSLGKRPAQAPGLGIAPGLQLRPPNTAFTPQTSPAAADLLAKAYEKLATRFQPPQAAQHESAAPQPPATDYSPDAVAQRILGFVGQRLEQEKANGADVQRLQNLYQQATKGIAQGLQEARGVLSKAGVFNGDIHKNYTATEEKLKEGMQALHERLFAPAPQAGISQGMFMQSALYESRSFSLEVRTQEGDVVTLNVRSAQGHGVAQSATQQAGLAGMQLNIAQSSAFQLDFSVEGDLNDKEQRALTELFGNINQLADRFYQGDIEQAFKKALSIGYDGSQIAGFALELRQTQVYQATAAYGNVAKLGNSQASAVQGFMPLADFARDIMNTAEQLRQTQTFEQPHAMLNTLLKETLPLHGPDNEGPKQHLNQLLDTLLKPNTLSV